MKCTFALGGIANLELEHFQPSPALASHPCSCCWTISHNLTPPRPPSASAFQLTTPARYLQVTSEQSPPRGDRKQTRGNEVFRSHNMSIARFGGTDIVLPLGANKDIGCPLYPLSQRTSSAVGSVNMTRSALLSLVWQAPGVT